MLCDLELLTQHLWSESSGETSSCSAALWGHGAELRTLKRVLSWKGNGPIVKVLATQARHLNVYPQHHGGMSPVIPALGRQNREDPGAHWPANLVEWVGELQVQGDSVSQNTVRRGWGKHLTSSSGPNTHAHIGVPAPLHIYVILILWPVPTTSHELSPCPPPPTDITRNQVRL